MRRRHREVTLRILEAHARNVTAASGVEPPWRAWRWARALLYSGNMRIPHFVRFARRLTLTSSLSLSIGAFSGCGSTARRAAGPVDSATAGTPQPVVPDGGDDVQFAGGST